MTNQQHSGIAIFLSLLETIGLILIGVFATEIGQTSSVIVVLTAAVLIGIARYLMAATARRESARKWFAGYLDDATDLENVLRGISAHGMQEFWDRGDLVESIQWWFDEDLVNDWRWEQDRRSADQTQSTKGRAIYTFLRHPVRGLRRTQYFLEKKLIGDSDLKLLGVVAQLPNYEVARMVIKAGIATGFVEQLFEHDKLGYKSVKYRSILMTSLGTAV